MQIIKAKYLKDGVPNGRDYTFFSNEAVTVGDTVQISEKIKGVVTAIDVPESEIESFRDKVKAIIGMVPDTIYRIIDIQDAESHRTRTDGRYPLRIGRTCKNLEVHKGAPLILEYVANADGSDYSNYTLRTSTVLGYEELGGRISVQTMHSIYIFEKESN